MNIFSAGMAMLYRALKSSAASSSDVVDACLCPIIALQTLVPVTCIVYTLFRSEDLQREITGKSKTVTL